MPSTALMSATRRAAAPFCGLLDPVIVDDHGEFGFEGAIRAHEAQAVWNWLARDIAVDLLASVTDAAGVIDPAAFMRIGPDLLVRARGTMALTVGSPEAERRLRVQLGGGDILQRLPVVLNGLRCMPLFDKARAFGRATNGLAEDETTTALQSMPRQDPGIAALLMMAAVGEVIVPARLIVAATRIAGEASEDALRRTGFNPLLCALLAQAQNTFPPLFHLGPFADIDLVCRSIDRFHRLIRAITGHVELNRNGQIERMVTGLTRAISEKLEPRLREVPLRVNQGLRRMREGADRLDSDELLAAVSGIYLLTTVRDCRDSLAVNEAFDESWNRAGETLEMHLTRNLEALRENPLDAIAQARVDAGIKMAEIRFGADYAEILRRARDSIERRGGLR